MRVKNEQAEFLKQSIRKYLPDAVVYLIGSRANDKLKGGDIDILVMAEKDLRCSQITKIKSCFKYRSKSIDIYGACINIIFNISFSTCGNSEIIFKFVCFGDFNQSNVQKDFRPSSV